MGLEEASFLWPNIQWLGVCVWKKPHITHTSMYSVCPFFMIWATTWQNNQMSVHTGKTQISLGICPVWSESSLSAWRKLADAQADLNLRWAHSYFVGFVMRRLILLLYIIHLMFVFLVPCWKSSNEASHEKKDLNTVHLVILQMHMHSHQVSQISGSCEVFFPILCERTVNGDCMDAQVHMSL